MVEKDMTENILEDYNDVFADIMNVLLFNGDSIVSEGDLDVAAPRSIYKADHKLHAQERDVAKYWRNGTIRIALYGIENQTDIDQDMPLRLFSYDGAAYRTQLLTDRQKHKKSMNRRTLKKKTRYPIITLVLYFGYERHWKKPRTLFDCLSIPGNLKPFVNDYKVNLFEIAWLEDEQVQQFKSDFRLVADYFVQMRKNKKYVAPDVTIQHVHELLQLMSILTQDHRFEDVYNPELKGGMISMCEALDIVENRGIAKGLVQGKDYIRSLFHYLISNNRMEDLKKAAEDEQYCDTLLAELFPEPR